MMFFIPGGQCTELVPKPPDLNYQPSIMTPAPARPLVIGWQVDHNNLGKLYITPEYGYNNAADGFRRFFMAQGHIVEHLLQGTIDQVYDPATNMNRLTDVTVIALPRQEITSAETVEITTTSPTKGFIIIVDHGFTPETAGYPAWWGMVKNHLMPAIGVEAENTSVNYCNGLHWCPIVPNQEGSVSFPANLGQVFTYEGSSLAPADSPNESCILEYPADTYDLIGQVPTLGGHCQMMAVTVGCKKYIISSSFEPFMAYFNLRVLNGFSDPNNPNGEEFAYALMEWLGDTLEAGEGTCPL